MAEVEIEGELLSPQIKALHELGVKLLEESLKTGRDFAALMIRFSFGSIPVYMGLLQFLTTLPAGRDPGGRLDLVVPVGFFVLASVLFIVSYLPRSRTISVDVIEDITDGYWMAVRTRRVWNICGTLVFIMGIGAACYMLLFQP